MEDRQGKRSSKSSIMKGLNLAISPINIHMDNHLVIGGTGHYQQETNCRSPMILDPYSEKLDISTPIARFFRSRTPGVGKFPSIGDEFSTPVTDVINVNYRTAAMNRYADSSSGTNSVGSRGGIFSSSPLSAMENLEISPASARSPQIYGAPVEVDEEVLVIDGVFVSSVAGGARLMRQVSDSGGGGGSSSMKCLYKTDICRSWEDSGSCRYGHKCQFAHGKEELRSTRLPVKNKPKLCESMIGTAKFRSTPQYMGMRVVTTTSQENLRDVINKNEISKWESRMALMNSPASIIQVMHTKPNPIFTIPNKEWSPEDDGIQISLPDEEDINQYIHGVLYGSISTQKIKKRFSVFLEIYDEQLQE